MAKARSSRAHFYRSLQIDGHANPINNETPGDALGRLRASDPPGAADAAHYVSTFGKMRKTKFTLHARSTNRKFSWFNTHFSFAGPKRTNGAGRPWHSNHA